MKAKQHFTTRCTKNVSRYLGIGEEYEDHGNKLEYYSTRA